MNRQNPAGFGDQYPWGFHGALSISLTPAYAQTAAINAETAAGLIVAGRATTFHLALDPLKQGNNPQGDPGFSDPPKAIRWVFEDGTVVATADVGAEVSPATFTAPTRTYAAQGRFEAFLKITTVAGRDYAARLSGRIFSA